MTVSGSNGLTLSGSITDFDASRIIANNSAGALTLSGSIYLSNNNTTGNTLTINGTGNTIVSGAISDYNGAVGTGTPGSLTIQASGGAVVTLSGDNTYSGSTNVGVTNLDLAGNANAFGTSTVVLGNMNTATIGIESTLGSVSYNNNVTFAAGGDGVFGGSNSITFAGTATVVGTPASSTGVQANDTGGVTFSGPHFYLSNAASGSGAFSITGPGNLTISAPISNSSVSGSTAVVPITIKSPSTGTQTTGTTTLSGVNSYTGLTTISATGATLVLSGDDTAATGGLTLTAGTVDINSAKALGTGLFTITSGTIDNMGTGPVVESNDHPSISIGGSFTFTGTQNLNLGTGNVTLTASPTITTTKGTLGIGGGISGTASITKTGVGTLALSGASTYSGARRSALARCSSTTPPAAGHREPARVL